jgi:hypothetical protein
MERTLPIFGEGGKALEVSSKHICFYGLPFYFEDGGVWLQMVAAHYVRLSFHKKLQVPLISWQTWSNIIRLHSVTPRKQYHKFHIIDICSFSMKLTRNCQILMYRRNVKKEVQNWSIRLSLKSGNDLFRVKESAWRHVRSLHRGCGYLPPRLNVNPNCDSFRNLQRKATKGNSLILELSCIPENISRCTARAKRDIMHSIAQFPSVCSNDWQRGEAGKSAAWL